MSAAHAIAGIPTALYIYMYIYYISYKCLLEFPQLSIYIHHVSYTYIYIYSQTCGAGQRTLTIWTFELLPRAVTLLLSGSRSRWIKSACTVEMPVKRTWSEAVACTGQGRTVSKPKFSCNHQLPADTPVRTRARPEKKQAYIHSKVKHTLSTSPHSFSTQFATRTPLE